MKTKTIYFCNYCGVNYFDYLFRCEKCASTSLSSKQITIADFYPEQSEPWKPFPTFSTGFVPLYSMWDEFIDKAKNADTFQTILYITENEEKLNHSFSTYGSIALVMNGERAVNYLQSIVPNEAYVEDNVQCFKEINTILRKYLPEGKVYVISGR